MFLFIYLPIYIYVKETWRSKKIPVKNNEKKCLKNAGKITTLKTYLRQEMHEAFKETL